MLLITVARNYENEDGEELVAKKDSTSAKHTTNWYFARQLDLPVQMSENSFQAKAVKFNKWNSFIEIMSQISAVLRLIGCFPNTTQATFA